MSGVFGAKEEFFDFIATEVGEVFGDEEGVVEAAGANVAGVGGERDDGDLAFKIGQSGVEEFGERAGEGADRMIFKVADHGADKTGARTEDKNWRLVRGGGR